MVGRTSAKTHDTQHRGNDADQDFGQRPGSVHIPNLARPNKPKLNRQPEATTLSAMPVPEKHDEMRAETPAVHLIDASIYIFRAWYSMPEDFADPRGRPTNAVYGFARFLCEFLEHTATRHAAVAFDESLATSFRNEIFADYKANREPPPVDLERQFKWCKDLAGCLGLPVYFHARFEADDLIAALSRYWRGRGHAVAVVTGDKDLAQLLDGPDDCWWDFARRNRLDAAGSSTDSACAPIRSRTFSR